MKQDSTIMLIKSKITSYPILELFLFLVVMTVAGFILTILKFNLWIEILIFILTYPKILGHTFIVILSPTTLKVISLNLFIKSHIIQLNAIIKINSQETSESKLDYLYGAAVYSRKQYYFLKYLNTASKEEISQFAISNKRKEQLIIGELKKIPKAFSQ